MTAPDWTLWRSFAAVVAEGSLSGAARRLGLSQPTVGRHVDALEETLGGTLFDRVLTGLKPTALALRLYEPVAAAEQALAEAAMIAEGAGGELAGTVRITASQVVSHYLLPGMMLPIREGLPQVQIELVPSDSAENLLMREADIAIRMFRPTQLDLVTRKLGELPVVPCAHASYLERRGMPVEIEDLSSHDLIGLDRSETLIEGAKRIGFPLRREDFVLRTDNQPLAWELIKAGLGIGFAQASLIKDTPGMRAILPQLRIPPLEVWLTTHRDLIVNARIRAVYDHLARELVGHIARSAV